MRRQLRPFWPPEQLTQIYANRYDHTRWEDHKLRIKVTQKRVQEAVFTHELQSVIDLSCGDGAIAQSLVGSVPRIVLGDITSGWEVTGPIMETIKTIPDASFDLFICSETLEHVEDPDALVREIRRVAHFAFFSTPENETDAHNNPEHYWAWDKDELSHMLNDAGFSWAQWWTLPTDWYTYQMWLAR